ncbi:MAG: hydroxyacylglutathione hydrolase [Magnetococcales bacterium]|nr:hydroxyacylglutathione hydrolase [Magnetococcales bacterium]
MSPPTPNVEPVLVGRDNLVWMIPTIPGCYVAIDPGEAGPVVDFLTAQNATLSHILITHHHGDHIGGVEPLRARYGCAVIGAEADAHRLPSLDLTVREGDRVALNRQLMADVLEVPGHTLGHLAYRIGDGIFCGDTLFGFGCGRLFEGTPAQMWSSLSKLRALPDDTRLFAGHEYTLVNLDFTRSLDPDNRELARLRHHFMTILDDGGFTLPHPLQLEKAFNPFLNADNPVFLAHLGLTGLDPVTAFATLRERRNHF